MNRWFFLLGLFALALSPAQAELIQQSHDIFFAPHLRERVSVTQSFPLFWWNFVIFEKQDDEPKEKFGERVRNACKELRALPKTSLQRVECLQDLSDYGPYVEDWTRDQRLLFARPENTVLKNQLLQSLTQASLVSGQPFLLDLLRQDPLARWQALQKIAEARLHMPFHRDGAIFWDEEKRHAVIPIQFALPPASIEITRQVHTLLTPFHAREVGPHFGAQINQERVMDDLHIVSWIGLPLLLLFGIFLLWKGRWQFLLLVPVVLVSTAFAAALTVFAFGGIHGLTLSFGSGIVGIALDYGLHGALNPGSRQIWKANLYGYLTSLAGLFFLFFSEIPLIRQISFFSILGLTFAYLSYFELMKRYPKRFTMKPIFDHNHGGSGRLGVVGAFLIAGMMAPFFLTPTFNLEKMDYQPKENIEARNWVFKKTGLRAPLVRITERSQALDKAHEEKRFAESLGIEVENIAAYLPTVVDQAKILATWIQAPCANLRLTESLKKFFSLFLSNTLCAAETPIPLSPSLTLDPEGHRYLSHLESSGKWLSAWFPKNEAEERAIQSRFSDANSLRELISTFPQILEKEMRWMVPATLILTLMLMFAYYGDFTHVLISMIPFATGVGALGIAALLFKLEFTFISLIGLLMIFGISLDFGIFATNFCFKSATFKLKSGVWSTLRLSALATAIGFVPFLFCKHPVLKQLGESLVLGMVGTYVGSLWGIPGVAHLLRAKSVKAKTHAT